MDVPQLKARTVANHTLARVARAEFEAGARVGQVRLRHVRGHSGDPGTELADAVADLGCLGEV